jgi:hypothetical protein
MVEMSKFSFDSSDAESDAEPCEPSSEENSWASERVDYRRRRRRWWWWWWWWWQWWWWRRRRRRRWWWMWRDHARRMGRQREDAEVVAEVAVAAVAAAVGEVRDSGLEDKEGEGSWKPVAGATPSTLGSTDRTRVIIY